MARTRRCHRDIDLNPRAQLHMPAAFGVQPDILWIIKTTVDPLNREAPLQSVDF